MTGTSIFIMTNLLTRIAHLKLRNIMPVKEFNKLRDHTSTNNFINWRTAFYAGMESKSKKVLQDKKNTPSAFIHTN